MSEEEQKIIDLENEISFLKNVLYEKQKEIEVLREENFDTVYIQAIENYKTKIRKIIGEHYPDVAITKLQELLEE